MTITRRWQSGFEAVSTGEIDGGRSSVVGGGRSGTYANSMLVSSGSIGDRRFYKTVSDNRQIRAGFVVKCVAEFGDNLNGEVLAIKDGATRLIEIRINRADSNAILIVDGSQEDSTTDTPLSVDTWMHFGINVKVDNAAGWAYVYLNGAEILSFAGDTGNVNIDTVDFGSQTDVGSGTVAWLYDDCYIDDTTDEGSAAVCPLLRFHWVSPNATGNYDAWVGSDGNNTDNYALVDERGPSTADYVEEDTVDQFDSYAMTTYTLGAGEQIDAFIPMIYAQRYGAAEEIALGSRYSGTDAIGSDQDPGFGAWSHTWERQTAKPGGGAWTQAALDAIELVIKSRGSF